jgi:thiol-disulfide isomerase/thioredoxin
VRLAALLLLVLATACGAGGSRPHGQPVDLRPLRQAAALAPCPQALGRVVHLTLPCLGGGPDVVLDSGAIGRPALVNVYGSWCGPCRDEMPLLAALAGRAGGRLALVGVDTEDDPRLALLFARDMRQHWAAVRDDDGRFLRHYGPGPPLTLFLDRAGTVVFVHRGAFTSLEDLRSSVRTHLGVSV